LPLVALAALLDHSAGLPLAGLLTGALGGLVMALALALAARAAAGFASPPRRSMLELMGQLAVLGPVALALALGLSESGAPLAPSQAPAWLPWSPLGWCLTWLAENPDLGPRSPSAPYGALLVAATLWLLPSVFGSKSEASHGAEQRT
jgi:hypothetical protein